MANKITVLLDLVTDKATTAAKGFKASVAEAEGAAGKFKAGVTSAFASLSTLAGPALIGAGAALTAFGAKAVAASQETALAAGKLADATGLTVESASRLREVGADLGISGETITAVVKKMSVEIGKGNPLLEQYGIALQHTSDGAADVNATLLDTIKRIGAIEDPTKRAAAAQAAFGRGYAEAAELIFSNADRLQQKLNEVSDAKVVTQDELARAREFRDSLENLKDVGEDLTVTVGNLLIPALTELADDLTGIATAAEDAKEALDKVPGLPKWLTVLKNLNPLGQQVLVTKKVIDAVQELQDTWQGAGPDADRFNDSVLAGGTAAETAAPKVAELGAAVEETGGAAATAADELVDLGDKAANSGPKIGDMAGALADARESLADLNEEARDNALDALANAIQGVADAVDKATQDVRDNLDLGQLLDDITDQFEAVREAGQDATDPESLRKYRTEVRRLREMLLDLLGDLKNVSAQDKIKLTTEIERGSVDDLFGILGQLSKGIVIPVSFTAPPTPSFSAADVVFGSGVGPTPIFQNPNPAPVDNSQTTIIYPVGSSPTTTLIDQRLYATRNGTNPR